MTTNNTNTRSGPYAGNGVTTDFAVSFYFLTAEEIKVSRLNADLTVTTLVNAVDYTVTGAGVSSGGTISLLPDGSKAPVGSQIIITPLPDIIQPQAYPAVGAFPSAAAEQGYDRLTIIALYLQEQLGRSLKLAATTGVTAAAAPTVSDPIDGTTLIYNATTNNYDHGPTATNIAAAQGYADAAAASVTQSASYATQSQSYLNSFLAKYYGAAVANPAVDPLGNPVTEGALYWNSTSKALRVYNGTLWVDPLTAVITTLGDTVYGSAGGGATRLPGNTSATKKFLTQIGTGTISAAPTWGTIAAADVSGLAAVATTGAYGNLSGTPALGALAALDTITLTNFLSGVIDTDPTLTANTDDRLSTQRAVKTYVDNRLSGLQYKIGVKTKTAVALPSNTYANGASGVGATLTATANGSIGTVGGYATPTVGDRYLVDSEAAGANNGLYSLTQVGDASHPYILTRVTDADTSGEMTNATVTVTAGTYVNTQWTCNATSIVMGTTALTFVQLPAAVSYTQGNGITITANVIAVDITVTATLTDAQSLTNKNLASSTNVLGGVTMTLGSDANGDTYYRAAGVLTRIAPNSTATKKYYNQTSSGAPAWSVIALADIPSGVALTANNLSDVASAATSFNNISPMTTLGDVIYGAASGSGTRLAGNITTTKKYLSQTGNGSVSAAPSWAQVAAADISGLGTLATLSSVADSNFTGQLAIAHGGTGAASQTSGFNALSPCTTKGDLIVRDATNNIRLAVGADNLVLVADSAQTSGIKWATVASVGSTFLDGSFRVQNTAAPTKQFALDVSAVTAGQTRTWAVPDANGTFLGLTNTQSPTNKTITGSTNVLGGVTMTLGSDATGDMYYRASNVLTRLGIGSAHQFLGNSGGLPAWARPGFDDLSDVTVSTVTHSTDTAVNQRKFVLAAADFMWIAQASTAGHPFSDTLEITRTADYTGGSTGWVNSALYAKTTVNSGATSNEWTLAGIVDNSGGSTSAGPAQVGVYGQANLRTTAAGNIVALVGEAQDYSLGTSILASVVAMEADCYASGTNANNNRIGINVVAGMTAAGVKAKIWAGIYFTSTEAAGAVTATYMHGLHIGNDETIGLSRATATYGVTVLADGTYGLWDRGTKTAAAWFEGVYSGPAIVVNHITGAKTNTPPALTGSLLQLANADSTATALQLNSFASQSQVWLGRAQGTAAAKTTLTAGVTIGHLNGYGYDGAAYSTAQGRIAFVVDANNWSAGDHGTFITFSGTPAGSTTMAEFVRFQAGNIGLNNSSGLYGGGAGGVLAMINATTAPTSTATNGVLLYAAASATSNSNLFAVNEAGKIEQLTGLKSRVSTQFDKTSNTTLANVTGLSLNVVAGKSYYFVAELFTSSNVAGGVKVALSGTATMTSVMSEVLMFNAAAISGQTRVTALNSAVGITAVTVALIKIAGIITVNAAGTFTIQFAQNASNGATSSVLVGSTLNLFPIGD